MYKIGFLVQVWRHEALAVKHFYVVRASQSRRGRGAALLWLLRAYCFPAGNVQVLEYAPGQPLWPELALLKARLRRCGVRQARLLQPESHDEIIGRPKLLEADPGLWLALK